MSRTRRRFVFPVTIYFRNLCVIVSFASLRVLTRECAVPFVAGSGVRWNVTVVLNSTPEARLPTRSRSLCAPYDKTFPKQVRLSQISVHRAKTPVPSSPYENESSVATHASRHVF